MSDKQPKVKSQKSKVYPELVEGSKVILGIRCETAEATIILCCHPEEEAPLAAGRSYRSGSLDQVGTIQVIDSTNWTAGRQLSATLLPKIDELLNRNAKSWQDLSGIVVYDGPGSFTGLRIGITVANTAAFVLNIPVVGATDDDWVEQGMAKLKSDHFTTIVTPFYGAEANITKPKT